MRVITGVARGRVLQTLQGDDVRPTTDRVKEAIFSVLQFELEGRRVLDLFAGSGQLGIEALSRGAKNAVFVDASADSISVIKANIQKCKLETNSIILNKDAFSYLSSGSKNDFFDIVFLDPPYDTGLLEKVLPEVTKKVSIGGCIVCETPFNSDLPETVFDFAIAKTYKYGKIKITVYRNKEVLSK